MSAEIPKPEVQDLAPGLQPPLEVGAQTPSQEEVLMSDEDLIHIGSQDLTPEERAIRRSQIIAKRLPLSELEVEKLSEPKRRQLAIAVLKRQAHEIQQAKKMSAARRIIQLRSASNRPRQEVIPKAKEPRHGR